MSTAVKTSPAVAASPSTPECKTIVDKFCLCGSLRTGAIVCTIFAAIICAGTTYFDPPLIGTVFELYITFMAINTSMLFIHITGAVGIFCRKLDLIRFHAIACNVYAIVSAAKLAIPFIIKNTNGFLMASMGVGVAIAGAHLYFALHVWSYYQLERFNAANAVTVVVTPVKDIEAGVMQSKAYPPSASK
ncbi:hypothetical protein HDU96_003890 [Phlyctochytrium bullatum]|nr:hypothetical protein HDU96_003890 [Phlyctochytrium bullatum]